MKRLIFISLLLTVLCSCEKQNDDLDNSELVYLFKKGSDEYSKGELSKSFKSIDEFLTRIDNSNFLNDSSKIKELTAYCYVGDIHQRLGNYEKALENYTTCKNKAKKYKIHFLEIAALVNLADIAADDTDAIIIINNALQNFENTKQNEYYLNQLKHKLSLLKAKQGLYNESKTIANSLFKSNAHKNESKAKTLSSLQRLYGEIYSFEEKYDSALLFYNKALALNNEFAPQQAEIHLLIAKNYIIQKQYNKSEAALMKAKYLIKDDLLLKKQLNELYLNIYEATNKSELGFGALSELRKIDNILNNENNKIQGYISDKIENENVKSLNTLQKARTNYIAGIAILSLLLFTLFHLYKQTRNKRYKLELEKDKLELEIDKEKLQLKNKQLEVENKDLEVSAINKVIDAQEKQQKKFAEILHDNVGANLSALNMFLSTLQKDVPKKKYTHLTNVLTKTIKNTRSLSHLLQPPALKGAGLISAIVEKAEEFCCDKINIAVNSTRDYVALEDNVEYSLYNVLLEFMNNTMRHAEANKMQIDFSVLENDKLSILVVDNGKGFDVNNMQQSKGWGLNSIKSRVNHFGGSFNIQSSNQGTVINIKVPVKAALKQSA